MRRWATALAGCLLAAGCTGTSNSGPGRGPVAPATLTPYDAASFDCGTLDVRSTPGPATRRALTNADVCLRDALVAGQRARFVRVTRVGGHVERTSYDVTARGALSITETQQGRTRARRCVGAVGLFRLGRCTRDTAPPGRM